MELGMSRVRLSQYMKTSLKITAKDVDGAVFDQLYSISDQKGS